MGQRVIFKSELKIVNIGGVAKASIKMHLVFIYRPEAR